MSGMRLLSVMGNFSKQLHYTKWHKVNDTMRAMASVAANSSSKKYIQTKLEDDVLVVTLDCPGVKVNSLGEGIIEEFESVLKDIETNAQVKSAVLISGKPDNFIAGADISMLEKCETAADATRISQEGQYMFKRMERSRKPIVAAINGVCLGGGLELALACHYRIATKSKKTKLGLPEVMLGLLPGSGGTVRLPKLTGVPTALDMELTGKQIPAERAKKVGVIDMLVDPLGPGLGPSEQTTMQYLEKVAIQIAKDMANGKLKVNREKSGLVNKLTALIN